MPSSLLDDDILRYIFVLVAKGPAVRDELEDRNWYAVSQVCRNWRAVALDTADVWSNINCQATPLEMIRAQLSRSKNANLSLVIIEKPLGLRLSKMIEIRNAIEAHKERVAGVWIEVNAAFWHELNKLIVPYPPKLNSLHLNIITNKPRIWLTTIFPKDFLSLTGLQNLYIANFNLGAVSNSLGQPLRSLVDLTFDNVDFYHDNLHEILLLCPNLEDLTVVCAPIRRAAQYDEDEDLYNLSPHVQLSSLRNFKIYGLYLLQAHYLLENFDLPVCSNWDLKCLSFGSFGFEKNHEDYNLNKTMIYSRFSHHTHYDFLHIELYKNEILFRTESILDEAEDDRTVTTTNFVFDHHLSCSRITDRERCAFLTNMIRGTDWRKVKTFRFHFNSGEGEITNSEWVDLLGSFDNLSSLEIMLPVHLPQSQSELSAALRYTRDHDVLKTTLESFSLRMALYDEEFIDAVKYFLSSSRYKDAKISKLMIEYPSLPQDTLDTTTQNSSESLSGYAQELQVAGRNVL